MVNAIVTVVVIVVVIAFTIVVEDIIRNLSPYSNKYCVIGSFNINSLSGKFSEVQEWIQVFDILTIQETKIDSSFPNSQFAIEGYNMYRRDRKKGGGGIVLYIRKTIPSYRLRIKCKRWKQLS